MAIGDKLKELREINHVERPEVARALGLPYTTYTNYETNQREPKQNLVLLMAEYFGVSTDYLLGREEKLAAPTRIRVLPIRINVLGRVPAGIAVEAVEDIIDWEELDPREYDSSKNYFGLLVTGESMSPKYLDGDVVIVEQMEDAESGKDVIAYINGHDATLKRLVKYGNGNVDLKPLNPAYQTMTFTPGEIETKPVRVIGIVKELRRKI